MKKLAIPLMLVLLAGCATGKQAEKQGTAPVEEQGANSATTSGTGQENAQGQALPEGQAATKPAEAQRKVYFAFDSSNVDDQNKAVVEKNAGYLVAHPNIKVELQGNTDERGTREYNLALGERRAKAVKAMLQIMGVAPDRMNTVSFGEEKPVALGHNEAAWRQNRRVDIVYK